MANNFLYTCDNLFLLNGMNSKSVDLIYLDPPFNSKRTYSAPVGSKSAGASFNDMWVWDDVNPAYLESLYGNYPDIVDYIHTIYYLHSKAMGAYITYMTQRLLEMHRILKSTGSIYLHIDPTASHYLKLVMDGIFGKANFINEIVWHYQTGGASKRWFSKKHDTILIYGASDKYKFNIDDIRVERTEEVLRRLATGSKNATRASNETKLPMDVWTDIQALNAMAKERTGYPTQKPLALLHRIIKASSNVGDVVFDPFCGCATACVASQQLNRQWIGCDIEEKSADILVKRLADEAGMFKDFVHTKTPSVRTDVEKIAATLPIKDRLYQEQAGLCNGCYVEMGKLNLEIDHIIPRSKGGGDYYENYQLLCGHCNRTKGNRTMEYLNAKLNKVKENRVNINYE